MKYINEFSSWEKETYNDNGFERITMDEYNALCNTWGNKEPNQYYQGNIQMEFIRGKKDEFTSGEFDYVKKIFPTATMTIRQKINISTSNQNNIVIQKLIDEWFFMIVFSIDNYGTKWLYYKCDQATGLINCLQHIKKFIFKK